MTEPIAHRDDGESPYVTVPEAAALLRVTGAAITKWLRDGTLRGRKLGLRRWRVERASVEAALPPPVDAAGATAPLHVASPYERVLALAPFLSEWERKQAAIALLSEEGA